MLYNIYVSLNYIINQLDKIKIRYKIPTGYIATITIGTEPQETESKFQLKRLRLITRVLQKKKYIYIYILTRLLR